MNDRFKKLLDETNDVHTPLPVDERETAEARMLQKEVLETRLVDDMESLEHFTPVTEWAKLELSAERCVSGEHSLKFSCPTNLDAWGTARGHGQGRIYDIPSAHRSIANEDWTQWNRLSVWIYPDCPGMKSLSLRMQLHNSGAHKVPDKYDREGGHNFSLKQGQWNHVVLEMPYVARDCVTGVSFDYDMVGHEPEATDRCVWYIDRLELQKVKCDVFEGWIPAEDRICYSHSGYQCGGRKAAIASGIKADTFRLIETETGRVVLEKPIERVSGRTGELQVLNFSEIIDEGNYIIVAGGLSTRVFAIAPDVWESSVWKVLNFFLVLRCGHEVPGKHRRCHADMLLKHGDQSIVADGGWHDAADLAQGMNNTSEATQALFYLAKALKGRNDRLYRRVLEEAKWGLDYVLKTRFGDGYRASYSSCSIWTDGVIGTKDDIVSIPTRSAYANLDAAYAMALGASALREADPDYAAYSLRIAREDYALGIGILGEINEGGLYRNKDAQYNRGDIVTPQIRSIAALAAVELYRLTKEPAYRQDAEMHSLEIAACQQRRYTDWDVPMAGFYYEDKAHSLIWHHNHMSYAYLPDMAMAALCEAFPDSPHYMLWYSSLKLSGMNYLDMARYTEPYGVIPSGVYHVDEAADHLERIVPNHPMMGGPNRGDIASGYRALVEKGMPLGPGYYLRVYPVWFSFRGNYNVLLSDGKAAAAAARVTGDPALHGLAQRQFQWIVGLNPMAQSTLYGEGYDYVQLYAVQPGQTVGALSVGMQTNGDNDEPFWPQVNNATYKEVWVCSATKWMWGMADHFSPAAVSGYLTVEGTDGIAFEHRLSGKVFTAPVHPRTGRFELELPTGEYTVRYAGAEKRMTVLAGNSYTLDGELYDLRATLERIGNRVVIALSLAGKRDMTVKLKAHNLKLDCDELVIRPLGGMGSATVSGTVENVDEPVFALALPNGNIQDKVDVLQ